MINPLRHLEVFSPDAFGMRRVDVIGVGATGSHVVLHLAKLGVENIHIWDFDTVEKHNVANQAFGLDHVGLPKVEAMRQIVKQATGTNITVHPERADGSQPFGEVVFLLTDSMTSRKEIFERGIKMKIRTHLMVETRMGSDQGRVYSINPASLSQVNQWVETLYSSEPAQQSACGATTSVGPTAAVLAGLALWQFIEWFAVEQGAKKTLNNEIVFALSPFVTAVRQF